MSTGPEVCPALFARIITHLFPCPYFCLSHTSLYPDHHFPPILFISSFALSFPACLAQHISSLPQPIMSDPSEYDQVIRPPAEEHLSDALAAFGQDLTDDPVWQDSITFPRASPNPTRSSPTMVAFARRISSVAGGSSWFAPCIAYAARQTGRQVQ
jgi:hypothetical protein